MTQTDKESRRRLLIPVLLVIVIFIALGFIQIIFQSNLQKALDQSQANFDKMVQTQTIINHTLYKVQVSIGQTNDLTTFLTDNFGSDSGYLEKENFQYDQANRTFAYLRQSLDNQQKIMEMLNQTSR